MRETAVETFLTGLVESHGGLCEKHVSPGLNGVPDRLITWRDGRMFLVETKAPKKGPRGNQLRDHKRRSARGVKVHVISTLDQANDFVFWLFATEEK